MAAYTVDQVADTLIAIARAENIEISNLKLQKLLYYAQAWSLVLLEKPLFDEDFEAWIHGPVVPAVFRRFKSNRWNVIADEVHPIENVELTTHLRKVLKIYGKATPNQLERLSHSEAPWKDARGGLEPDESSKEIISKHHIKTFYTDLLNAQKEAAKRRHTAT